MNNEEVCWRLIAFGRRLVRYVWIASWYASGGRVFCSYSLAGNGLRSPIALQEMVYAVWLIVKGFNPTASIQNLPSRNMQDNRSSQ